MAGSKKKKKKKSNPSPSIPVHCSHDKIVSLASLQPNPRNPNKHPENQIEALSAIIVANGWRSPITVSNRSGMIVRGHGRYMAAVLLKEKTAPVDYQNYKTEGEEWRDLLADNKIAELSERDDKKVGEILAEIPEADRVLSGYPEHESAPLVSSLDAEEPPPKPEPAGEVPHSVYFKAMIKQAAIIRKAIDKVKNDNQNPNASDGRCLELICAGYLS